MKRILQLVFLVLVIALSGCSKKVTTKKTASPGTSSGQVKNPTAPGQIKKVTGSQSAAPYAPGQQKKSATPSAGSNNAKKESTKTTTGEKTTDGGNGNAAKKKK